MIYKSYLVEENFKSLNKKNLILFYGENEGLKMISKNNKIRIKRIRNNQLDAR